MAKTKTIQNSMVSGIMSEQAWGRTDVAKFYSSVAQADNVIVQTTGGAFKRAGFEYVDTTNITKNMIDTNKKGVRLIDFVFNTEQKYIFVLYDGNIDIYYVPTRDEMDDGLGGPLLTLSAPELTPTIIEELSVTQKGDTTIIFHTSFQPRKIVRTGFDTFTYGVQDIITPRYDTGELYYDHIVEGTSNTVTIDTNDIVYYADDGGSGNGIVGYFYRARFDIGSIDINTEDYTNEARWEALTESPEMAPYWNDENGWPKYGCFFQGRLWCAGSDAYPLTVWGSKAQDYFDFYIDTWQSSEDGSPISDTIDSQNINQITGIFPGRNLQVFTTGTEFVNLSSYITPTNSSWQVQTKYGSPANVPLDSLDGSTFFVDRTGAIREFIYNYDQNANISLDLTTLAPTLFQDPFRVEIIRSAYSNLSRFTYILNTDGTLSVLNFDRNEGVTAWVKFTTDGFILDVKTVDNELYLLVSRDDFVTLERLDISQDTTYLDSFVVEQGPKPEIECTDGTSCTDTVGGEYGNDYFVDNVWCDTCIMFADPNTPRDYSITGLDRFEGKNVSVMLDGIYNGERTVENGEINIERFYNQIKIGRKISSKIKTLPVASPEFAMELNHKRIIKVKLYLYQSSGFYLDDQYIPSSYFDVNNFDVSAPVRSGVYEYWTLGWDILKQFEISNNDPLGFNILKFETHLDVSK